jgi:hypothetical protein
MSGKVLKTIDIRYKHPKETFHDFFHRTLDLSRFENRVRFIHDNVDISDVVERKIEQEDNVLMIKLTRHEMKLYLVWKHVLWTIPTTVPVYVDDSISDIMERAEDVVVMNRDFEESLDFMVQQCYTIGLNNSKIFRPPFDVGESLDVCEKLGIDEDASIVLSLDDDERFIVVGDIADIMHHLRYTQAGENAPNITPPWEDDNWDRSDSDASCIEDA